jgi:hypothetical protein
VVIDLSQGIAVTLVTVSTGQVRKYNLVIDPGMGLFQPGEQGRAKVETHVLIVVEQFFNKSLLVVQASASIGSIAFPCDALIPIVIRLGRSLVFNEFQPGILTRRLIEVAVDTKIFIGHWIFLSSFLRCGQCKTGGTVCQREKAVSGGSPGKQT